MLSFPQYATECIDILTSRGFEAYFVGGCVRDGLLGKSSDDIDITTNATPDEVMDIFPDTVPTGIKHGTITVINQCNTVEITTYRTEDNYKDGRHPDKVHFVTELKYDLSRRDFTINALASTNDGKIVDNFGGLNDLENKIIKAVGDPEKRFSEDALRIVRAYRFSSVLGFEIEEKTRLSALHLSQNLSCISGERILKELIKSADGIKPSSICELLESKGLEALGIGSPKYEKYVFDNIYNLHLSSPAKFALLIALCYHNTELIATKLKPSNVLLNKIKALDSLILSQIPANKTQLKLLLYKYDFEYVELYLHYLKITGLSTDHYLFELLFEIINNNEPYKISHLKVDGNTLKKYEISGIKIGQTLEKILVEIIKGHIKNTENDIIEFIKN